jgi:hypothetical protein
MAIFGIYGRQQTNAALPPGPEPVWVDGQMGVYNPDTGEFVPVTSPLFDQTCDLIQLRREQAQGYSGGGNPWGYHHWVYNPGGNSFWYSTGGSSASGYQNRSYGGGYGGGYGGNSYGDEASGGASGARSSSGMASHFGSSRGGIGETGHSFGGSHS